MHAFARFHRFIDHFLGIAAAALACAAASPAQAADKPGAKDFPSISRFQGAEIVDYKAVDFDEAVLPIQAISSRPTPTSALLKVEGKATTLNYIVPPNKTTLEVMRNYEQALGSSFKTVFSCAGTACGNELVSVIASSVLPAGWGHMSFSTEKNRYLLAQRSGPGGDVYALLYVMQEASSPVSVLQKVIEVKPMQGAQVTVVDAAAMQRGLEAEGKVAVYGVLFDTAKADVKPESKAALDEMAKLLTNNGGLKVYIVGHTDNAGTLAANLDLSQRRADAVAKALATTHKIDPQRLTARGVGSLAPVASNRDEAGRARNRRVELVLQ